MAPINTPDAPATSIAEAKLERQRRRIQEAEAALNAPVPHDKRNQPSRGKGKQWKPFDYTADSPHPSSPGNGGVLVSEVRVNTFRPSSQCSSIPRSMSVMSHRTNETGPSDMERQDSGFTENGFQLYKGRKNKKQASELGAYEDKPEERQITVEATFDKREIYDVFGNALPGPEFIEENVGFKNGQLQFIQHPNGDVSAHQWSTERYIWENIGQFSNIRKKVEGQLAADRLKGETAYQTLQQNTLAYFRIVAKQREANVMGVPFGTKDIQAAIPEPRVELAAAPTGLKEPAQESHVAEQPQATLDTSLSQYSNQDARSSSTEQTTRMQEQSYLPANVPKAPRGDHLNYVPTYGHQYTKCDDPFYSTSSYEHIYGAYPYVQPRYRQPMQAPQRQYYPTPQQSQGLNYNFHFPQTDTTNRHSQTQDTQAYPYEPHLLMQSYGPHDPQASRQSYSQYQNSASGVQIPQGEAARTRVASDLEVEAPRPKVVTPLDTRTAIRGQLWKHVETAKERSNSQANIRTVLYDPYQNQTSTLKAEQDQEPKKQDVSPAFSKNVIGNTLQPPSSFDPTSSKFFPTVLAPVPDIAKPTSPTRSIAENNLRDSSPDPYPYQHYNQKPPLIMTSSDSKPTPQTFKGPFFAAEPNLRSSIGSVTTSAVSNTSYDEQLAEWWTSGNTFARQEDFFQRLISARKESSSKMKSPPAHLTPIGPPSRTGGTPQKQEPQYNDAMTRLLIPLYENLASYVQGPLEKRRDYWSQWCQPPEWCIDRSEGGNDSFFDKNWGTPPARVGRDSRYSNRNWTGEQTPLSGRYSGGAGGVYTGGLDRRFAFGGRY